MAYIKPAALRTGKTGKAEIEKRLKAEESLKGAVEISRTAPDGLSERGKEIYLHVIDLLPEGFLSGADTYVVGIVADALDRMKTCQEMLNQSGMFVRGIEKDAVKTYERYSKIFDRFASKLGLSPKDRASLAVLNINAEEEKEDPVLAALRGEQD